jgi:hypothetical protein
MQRNRIAQAVLCGTLLTLLVSVPGLAAGRVRSASVAGCGGVQSVGPMGWHRRYRPPLAIGDSTMLLALDALSREGFSVNAHGCRQYPEALALLSRLRHANELPRVVVIDLGANGEVSEGDVTGALQILGHDRLLVLVTPRELGGGSGSDAQLVRAEGRRHPERVRVLDWVAYSAGHSDWFEPDGLHVSPRGSAAQTQLLAGVLPLDAPPRSVPSPHCPLPAPTPVPQAPLTGVALDPAGGVLDVPLHSSRVKLTLVNAGPFALDGLARVRESSPGGLTIAARCVSAAAQSRTAVLLTLPARPLAELELRPQYRVRLELVPSAAQGSTSPLTATYLLKRPSR